MDQGYFGVSDTPSMYQVVAFVVSMLVCGRVFVNVCSSHLGYITMRFSCTCL